MSKWIQPVKNVKLGPKFGVKDAWHPNGHRGTDYNGFKEGENLLAVFDGEIAMVKWSDVLGNIVVLKTTNGKFFGYCHMSKPTTRKVGEKVKSGDVIGHAGTTGSASSGVHLHLTLGKTKDSVISGEVMDAYEYLVNKIKEQSATA